MDGCLWMQLRHTHTNLDHVLAKRKRKKKGKKSRFILSFISLAFSVPSRYPQSHRSRLAAVMRDTNMNININISTSTYQHINISTTQSVTAEGEERGERGGRGRGRGVYSKHRQGSYLVSLLWVELLSTREHALHLHHNTRYADLTARDQPTSLVPLSGTT
ncbi:hypothetical protein GGR50DRAFT_613413 [Xylaria sp. CBS 124048]|nr:hypothetical protein GGR50DRAFT_613413 [Xylaria sp. CBS 124048]